MNAINLNSINIAILYTVEWLLDRVRTAINLYSHCFCTVITYELCKKNLNHAIKDIDQDAEQEQPRQLLTYNQRLNLNNIEVVREIRIERNLDTAF